MANRSDVSKATSESITGTCPCVSIRHASVVVVVQINRSVRIHGRSRIDTWQSNRDGFRRTKSVPDFERASAHVQSKARVDTWLRRRVRSASNMRSASIAHIAKPFHVDGRSKVDSWSTMPIQRKNTTFDPHSTYRKIEAKSRIDTWLSNDYRTRDTTVKVSRRTRCIATPY